MPPRLPRRFAVVLLWTCAVAGLFAAAQASPPSAPTPPPVGPTPSAAPETTPAARPAVDTIPQATLQEMYRRELGNKYRPEDAARLHAAHVLVEEFFSATTAQERKAVVAKLHATGLDPNLIGRITRVRMHWPQLESGAYYVNERVGPHQVRYFFGVPGGYDRTKPIPLVIKLPEAGPFIGQPRPDGDQVAAIYTAWISDELKAHPDAAVLMPLLNLDELWGPSYAGMNSVIQPLLHVAGRVNVDPARVYLLGHGMSAHAAWNLGLHYTTYFAAINPLAGSARADWQRLRLMNLRNTLPVVWHDASDPIIKVDLARALVRALRGLKINVEYEETKKVGHIPDAATAGRAYAKMRGATRQLYPIKVTLQSNRTDTMFNRLDWVQIWQPADPGEDRRLLLRRGSGVMVVTSNPFKLEADHPEGNRIDLATQNVDGLRVYLNDQMVNFAEPVHIFVNKKPRFSRMVKPSVEEMLKDQLFLGRGWRYFTGVVDIDVFDRPAPAPATRSTTRPTTRPATGATTRPTPRPGVRTGS
jgi:hypothetical protein